MARGVWIRTALTSLVLLLCSAGSAARAGESYEARLAHFKSAQKSASLAIRTEGQAQLAATRDPRAIEVLAKLYGTPHSPKERARHLIASTLARHFDAAAFVDALSVLRSRYTEERDAWLWYRTLVIHGRHAGSTPIWAAARDPELPSALRVAAIEAAATLHEPGLAQLAIDLLAALPADPLDQARLVSSLATGLLAVREKTDDATERRVSEALIAYVEREAVPESARVVVGRVLQQLLDARFAYLDGAAWRQHLEYPSFARKSKARRLQRVECAGTRSDGARIAFLIDASERGAWRATPEARKLIGAQGRELTRLEVMQYAVRAAIRALQPEQSFVIIYYAHNAVGTLPGLGRILPATRDNKSRAVAALEGISTEGPADLHAGLRMAFQVHVDGVTEDNEHLSSRAVLGGCDTIYVLAHSPSSVDQWVAKKVADRKEGARTLPSGGTAYGLYADPVWLREELQRWRVFRKAAVHAVAFGEAHEEVMALVARLGDGFESPDGRMGAAERSRPKPDERFLKALEEYRGYLKRPSLSKRLKGRSLLARTNSLLALEELARDYGRAEDPVPTVQQVLVDLCRTSFARWEALPLFARWRGRHTKRADAWLWHRALQLALDQDERRTALRTATEGHDPFLRAAAIRSLVKSMDREVLARIPGWVARVRASGARGIERDLPIEAMATALDELAGDKDEDVYKNAALALLQTFDDEATPARSKLTIVRNIAAGLEVPPRGIQKEVWVREVLAGGSGGSGSGHRYGPTFGGLRASGTRICYVIDMSDSMLTPLEKQVRGPVVTGRPSAKKRRPEDEINWARVKTRFDLARALLITSLQTLTVDMQYCVIWFGNEAGTLKSTSGLVASTRENIQRTVKELRAIKPGAQGAAGTGVKWGSLRGETNLHGGLTRALTRTQTKPLTGFTYVAERGLSEGCDTIFVLSDGAPSTDDFCCVDKADPGDHAVADRETGKRIDDVPELDFPGPYADAISSQLLNDIERRNLFRQVEIHCLGMGDANMGFLGRLARIGLGESRKIGDDKD